MVDDKKQTGQGTEKQGWTFPPDCGVLDCGASLLFGSCESSAGRKKGPRAPDAQALWPKSLPVPVRHSTWGLLSDRWGCGRAARAHPLSRLICPKSDSHSARVYCLTNLITHVRLAARKKIIPFRFDPILVFVVITVENRPLSPSAAGLNRK